jgi:uncharacterized protein (TIGR03435 family)
MRILFLLSVAALLASAQTFEVARVKPAAPYKGGPIHIGISGGPGTADPGRVTFENATLKLILIRAFDKESYQILGPDWLDSDMFDIAAKLPPDSTEDQFRMMLQNLLREHFGMTAHREKRDLPVYVLTAGKAVSGKGGVRISPPGRAPNLTCKHCTLGQFVEKLGNPGGRPVFDRTGLDGVYDFALSFEPDFGVCRRCDGPPPPSATAVSIDTPPVLTVAVQQQLGLKLEAKKMPIDVIVIDRIEKTPAGN